jgi:hypothetical protein
MIAVNITVVRVQMGKFLVDHHSCPLMFVMNFFWLKGELAVKNRYPLIRDRRPAGSNK